MRRADFVEALRRERLFVEQSSGDAARLAQIDEQLAFYSDQPADPQIEAAVPGPLTRRRGRPPKAD